MWRLLMAQIIQCLRGKTGGFDQITNKDAIILYSLENRINIDYVSIFWEDIIIKLNKKHREKVVPYTRFLSLLMMHKMKEGYGDGELTLYPTQISQWRLKLQSPLSMLRGFPKAQSLELNLDTRSIQLLQNNPLCPAKRQQKAPTGSKTGHSKKRKESSSTMDSNPSQPPVSTPMDTRMHKEDQQATSDPTSLGVTSEARANSQLSSGMLAFNLNEPIFSASFNIHSESGSGNDASTASTAEADPGNSAPSDFVPQQQGMNEGTKNTSYDHLFAVHRKEPARLLEKVRKNIPAHQGLEDLANLVSHVQPSFKDLDSPEDDHVIVVADSDEDEDDEVHATENVETEDTSVPKSSSPRAAGKFDELTEEVKRLKKQVHELEIELPGDLKEIPTKMEDFTKIVTKLTSQVTKLKTLQWELPIEFLSLPVQVALVQAKLKTLDALPGLLLNVTKALNKFAQVLDYVSSKARDQSVPLVRQADTRPAEGEKTQIKQPSLNFFKEELKILLNAT
ncbi:hypothetical protein Tco_0846269 [Tanacetum coccineum]